MLTPGARLGFYEVLGPLGAGGMGEVWRARDTRLGREVAIKVLPEAVASDAARLSRFEREAKLLASLNHPGIATVHGFEQVDGVSMLVQELVEGPTLAERLRRGPLPVREALELATQIAAALEAAHEKGIVHRDLKPSNVKLTADGRVKLLDFGLAKALDTQSAPDQVSKVSTDTSPTAAGVILGTAPYMSPEQARAEPVDERTDVWAFGCVLYEMLTGRRAFAGATSSDAIAAILDREPDWAALPPDAPPLARSVLRRCLQKDRTRRLHAIADAGIEIEEALTASAVESSRPAGASAGPARWVAAVAMVLLMAAAVASRLWPRAAPAAWSQPRRLSILIPASTPLDLDTTQQIALSADGNRLVFVSFPASGRRALFLRSLDDLAIRPIHGTEAGEHPFGFSPDGRWLGFGAAGKLMKVLVEGGAPITLCDWAPSARGASWGDDGSIVFNGGNLSGLLRVSAAGGPAERLTAPDPENENSHRWPQMLPGSRAVLFTAQAPSGRQSESRVEVLILASRQRRRLIEGGSFGRYVPTGHLVYALNGSLYAAPFDLQRLEVTGPGVRVLDDVRMSGFGTGAAQFAFSATGTLVYVTPYPRPGRHSLVWVDRKGKIQPVAAERRPYFFAPRLLAGGKSLTVSILAETGIQQDIWKYDVTRAEWSQETTGGRGLAAIWSLDGRTAAIASDADGPINIYRMAEQRTPERLTHSTHWQWATAWSPDGRAILFNQQDSERLWDIWVQPLDGDRRPRPLIATQANEGGAVFSPDGRWIAYASEEPGHIAEVFVRRYPIEGERAWRVSTDGGLNPVWSADGREIFYRRGNRAFAVPVTAKPEFAVGPARVLFEGNFGWGRFSLNLPAPFDVTPDGQRFLTVLRDEEVNETPQIVVIPDWFEELKHKVGAVRQ